MSSICDHQPQLLSLEEAHLRLRANLAPRVAAERVALDQSIGRTLAKQLRAPLDFPPFTHAAMDGYALHFEDGHSEARLKVLGTIAAGSSDTPQIRRGECVRILTGAPLPSGTDAVVVQEEVRREGDHVVLNVREALKKGANVRFRGEELRRGDLLLPEGSRIGPFEAGLVACAGLESLEVQGQLRVGVLATGSELVAPGVPLEAGQIYESNRPVLLSLIREMGHVGVDLGRVLDDPSRLKEQMALSAPKIDVLITTGGASEGDFDHMAKILREEGEITFWKVAIKPGKPFLFGEYRGLKVFGLPGNPVSSVITFLKLVQPALKLLSGGILGPESPLYFPLAAPIRRQPGRREFLRGRLINGLRGPEVLALQEQGSHRLTSLVLANCLISLPAEVSALSAGDRVAVECLYGILEASGARYGA